MVHVLPVEMEDNLQVSAKNQQEQQMTLEETGPENRSEMCIGWSDMKLPTNIVTGVTVNLPTGSIIASYSRLNSLLYQKITINSCKQKTTYV